MGIDNRGHVRKQCLVKDCDCDEYEMANNAESGYNCPYCACPPAKHKRDDSSSLDSSAPVQQSVKPGNEERGLRSSYTAQPQQKWKDKKYGWVPNAKRNKSLFGNELLPRFYDSFRERAGSDPSVMRKMFIAERDRRYSVVQDVRKCQASYQCLVSDNPACAGQFLCEKYHPKPHDNSNISRCEAEANKLKKKVETI